MVISCSIVIRREEDARRNVWDVNTETRDSTMEIDIRRTRPYINAM